MIVLSLLLSPCYNIRMDERTFVMQRRANWERLAQILAKTHSTKGARALSRDEVQSLGPLYRRVSSDLAYSRAHAVSEDLVAHLNGLVGQAHAMLYTAETSERKLETVVNFYLYDFPALLQKRSRHFLAAFAITLLGVVFAYGIVMQHPDRLTLFVPEQFKQSVEVWKSGKIGQEPSAVQSSFLMTHNLQIGLLAFASGVCFCLPAAYLLFTNGTILGALAALMTQVHHHDTLWPGILPHGIAELTAIFICGAAGLRIGQALLAPGPYLRGDAFLLAGQEAITLVLGTIPLFIFAGLIEGMFSHLPLSAGIRLAFAGLNGLLWYLYLFVPRERLKSK